VKEEVSCQQISFLSAESVSRFLLSAHLLFVSRFYQQVFCRQQICFSSANVSADVMDMTLTPAYAVSRQPVSCRKRFRLRPALIFASITIPFVLPDLPGISLLLITSLAPVRLASRASGRLSSTVTWYLYRSHGVNLKRWRFRVLLNADLDGI
jgi:hypothetical protein